ncbi:MAG: transposase [Ferruginibacter sp.]|nr:transposase [Ferruginibacter sp.]
MSTYLRKSHASIGKIYFWTATIHQWRHLLSGQSNKQVIIDYLKDLSDAGLITIFAFVVMPNHVHLIWRQNKMNGKESPFGSFLKYTAHKLLRGLKLSGDAAKYKVEASNKLHEIWKRDSLAIEIYSREVARQKIDYLHANPVSGRWKLAIDDLQYPYSSARFYDNGTDEFGFLTNLFFIFDGE